MAHLKSLDLPIRGKRVLEVGAGIGLLTAYFEEAGCIVLSTEGRAENVEELKRRFPHRSVRRLDLEEDFDPSDLGEFDVVFCYGTLYHLSQPEAVLNRLAQLSRELILLETCVTAGSHHDVHLVRESASGNQALGEIGCRPTRPWVMAMLTKYWGHAYATKTQPNHPDFEVDWVIPTKSQNHRAVFVGSKRPIANPALMDSLPDQQIRFGEDQS